MPEPEFTTIRLTTIPVEVTEVALPGEDESVFALVLHTAEGPMSFSIDDDDVGNLAATLLSGYLAVRPLGEQAPLLDDFKHYVARRAASLRSAIANPGGGRNKF
jgi:hypothetical protein